MGDSAPSGRGHVVAIGFGVTVAMWALAYLAMMRPGLVLGEVLFGAVLLCLALGGYAAGRWTAGGMRSGLLVGLLSATLNLMLVGALIGGRDTAGDVVAAALRWGVGTYVVSAMLAVIGAAIGAMRRRAAGGPFLACNWIYGFACVAGIAVLLLLVTGGLVTGLEAGLAVPDWPNSFGHNMLLYPLSEMVEGVYYEHAHRLYGMLVGVTTIALCVALLAYDRRRWLRALGVVLVVMVCVQGIMGGLRVTATSTTLAVVHGVFGQVFFATVVLTAAFVSTRWTTGPPSEPRPGAATDRRLSAVSLALLLLQLAVGALYRHLNGEPDVATGLQHGLLGMHVLLALVVAAFIVIGGLRGFSRYPDRPVLRRLGASMVALVSLQLVLGMAALSVVMLRGEKSEIPAVEVVFTTAHQATGALLLAGAALTVAWTHRVVR